MMQSWRRGPSARHSPRASAAPLPPHHSANGTVDRPDRGSGLAPSRGESPQPSPRPSAVCVNEGRTLDFELGRGGRKALGLFVEIFLPAVEESRLGCLTYCAGWLGNPVTLPPVAKKRPLPSKARWSERGTRVRLTSRWLTWASLVGCERPPYLGDPQALLVGSAPFFWIRGLRRIVFPAANLTNFVLPMLTDGQ